MEWPTRIGWLGQGGRDRRNILDIVADAAAMKLRSPFTCAMGSKTERMRLKAMGGEIVEKEFVPAPGAVPGPVDEQDRRRGPRVRQAASK